MKAGKNLKAYSHRLRDRDIKTKKFLKIAALFICVAALLQFLFYLNVIPPIFAGHAGNNSLTIALDEEIVLNTVLLFFGIGVGILLVRMIYERTSGSFFSSIIGILAAVVLSGEILLTLVRYFMNTYQYLWQRVCLAVSLLSFGYFFYAIMGFFPISAQRLIGSMRRKLIYQEIASNDWVKQGVCDYPLDVIKLDYIPQDTERVRGTDIYSLDSVLDRFISGASAKTERECMILIGGFGSGKSTALLNTIQRYLHHFNSAIGGHTGRIPVYVKLRDWINDKQDLENIRVNGKNVLVFQN